MSEIFGPLSDAFFWLLQFLHTSLGISWSWSIVVLTVIVRIILIPLTWRQLKSMRAMQALAPQIKALQEKYKDDREVLNRKTMEFYQENKVSPFGSCLPLVLQMPVFFGLYYMLSEAGKAGGAFAPPNPVVSWLWIADITKFDYLLMFLYMASQFVASWQTARKSPGQQKMIAYFMPVIVGIFMFIGKWPAGLFIYWVTSNLWTIAQQVVAEKLMPLPAAVVATAGGKTAAGKTVTGKSGPVKTVPSKTAATGGKAVPSKTTAGGKTAPKSAGAKGPVKPGNAPSTGKAPSKGGPTKAASGKGTQGKPGMSPSGPKAPSKTTPTKTTPATARAGKAPAGKTGGKSSGEQTGQQGQTATGEGQRPDGGTGGPEGSSRA